MRQKAMQTLLGAGNHKKQEMMKMVNRISSNSAYQINQQQMVIRTLMGKKSGNSQRDMFIRSGNMINDAGLYSPFSVRKSNYISDTLLRFINSDISGLKQHGNVYEYDGICFTKEQIPKVDTTKLSEVKAKNNVMDFGQNSYFKYVDAEGKEHALFTGNNFIDTVYSERMRGAEYDAVAQDYANFWDYMTIDDPVYYGLHWTQEQVRDYMGEAGIETGFFTVKVGEKEATQYYSASKTGGVIHSKERYDSKYQHLTSTGYELMSYEPGSVFKLNGKEYVLSENHTLDIPYGEDLWCLGEPENYRFGEKIY